VSSTRTIAPHGFDSKARPTLRKMCTSEPAVLWPLVASNLTAKLPEVGSAAKVALPVRGFTPGADGALERPAPGVAVDGLPRQGRPRTSRHGSNSAET
jgi:hypothetical protein